MKSRIFLLLFVLFVFLSNSFSFADDGDESEAQEEKKLLSKADAARLIVDTDFLKKKISQLLSWTIGYDISSINKAKLVPSIKRIEAVPIAVPPDGRTVFSLLVEVDDPGGLSNISGVRADLSNIGQLSNTALVDNGLWGDTSAGDGVYSIQTSVDPKIVSGKKIISVAVANKKGWLTLSEAAMDVERNPSILWAKASPENVYADGESKLILEASIFNPGRIEDVTSVKIDLKELGLKPQPMTYNGEVFRAEVIVPEGVSGGEKKLPITVENMVGGRASGYIIVKVK